MSFEQSYKKKSSSDLYGDDAYLIILSSTFCPPAFKTVIAQMAAFACATHAFACTASLETITRTAMVSEVSVKRAIRYMHANGILITQKVDDVNYARIFNPCFIQVINDILSFTKGKSKVSREAKEYANRLLTEFVETASDDHSEGGPERPRGGDQADFSAPGPNDHQNSVTDLKTENPVINTTARNKFPKDFWTAIKDVRAFLKAGKESFQQRQNEKRVKKAKPAYQSKKRDIMQLSTPDEAIPPGFHGTEPADHTAPVPTTERKSSLSMADRIALKANNFCAEFLPADLVSRALAAGEVLV